MKYFLYWFCILIYISKRPISINANIFSYIKICASNSLLISAGNLYFIGRLWWCLRTRVLEPIFDIKTTIYTYILTCKHTTHIYTQLNEYIYMRINTYV